MTYPARDVEALTKTYLTQPLDVGFDSPPGEKTPEQWSATDLGPNQVVPYVDGNAYFTAVDAEISYLLGLPKTTPGRYFYLTAWWLGLVTVNATVTIRSFGETFTKLAKLATVPSDVGIPLAVNEFTLPSGTPLRSRLAQLIGAGVDVRILAWTSPFAPKYVPVATGAGGITTVNLHSILSVDSLRNIAGPVGARKILLNTCAHPFGAAHTKMIVCGDATRMTAFTGGIDPAPGRIAPLPTMLASVAGRSWHDVAVGVRGPAAKGMFSFFRDLWNEQIAQPVDSFNLDQKPVVTHFTDSPRIDVVPVPPAVAGPRQRVQVLRTVPQMTFSAAGPAQISDSTVARWLVSTAGGFRRPPLSYAPDGLFEFHVALRKAIAKATKYIFITDQGFTSQEVLGWLNSRMLQHPSLKVILLHGADPADPPSGLLAHAVNQFLLPHLPTSAGTPTNLVVYGWPSVTVHGKVTIIDDEWAAVGSANCMRRSHFTDIEMSVAVVDADAPSFAARLRRDLWARYCGVPLPGESLLMSFDAEYNALADLNAALGIWKPAWAAGPPPAHLPALLPALAPYPLPMPAPGAPYGEAEYNQFDADSRQQF